MIPARDRGNASVEFVGVGALITIVALALLQFAVIAHVRAVVIDSAIAGAAYGSLADSTLNAGIERTRELVAVGVAADLITSVTGSVGAVSGRPVSTITVDFRVPAFALWVPAFADSVTVRAFIEQQ